MRRTMRAAIEQAGQRRIASRQQQHRRTAAFRYIAAGADRPIGQFANRPAIPAAGKTPGAEPVRNDAISRSAVFTRGCNDEIENLDGRLYSSGGGHCCSLA